MEILLLVIWTYFKTISILFSLVLLFANIEAYYLLNKKSYYFYCRWSNDAILPTTFTEIGDKHLSELFLLKFKLLVFNIAYSRVYYGKFYFLKTVSIRRFFIFVFLYYFSISRFFIILTLFLINYTKSENINDFLYDIFVHPHDSRKLIKINNVWYANGPQDFFANLLKHARTKTGLKVIFENEDINRINMTLKKINTFRENTKFYNAMFSDKNTKQHKVFLEATADKKKVGLQTDKNKSIQNYNYGKKPIILKYTDKKQSILLQENSDNLIQISKEDKISNYYQIKGAFENGYDNDLISNNYKKSLDEYTGIQIDIDFIINSKDWDIDRDTIMSSLEDLSFSGTVNFVKDL